MILALAAVVRNTRTVMEKMQFNNKKISDIIVNVNEITRIAQGVVLKGKLSANADIRVDGQVDGLLYSDGKVVVGESAAISGNVLCANVDIWGRIDGDVYVSDLMSVKSTAIINGNIYVRKLQIEIGAQINGGCKMISEEEFKTSCESLVGDDMRPGKKD